MLLGRSHTAKNRVWYIVYNITTLKCKINKCFIILHKFNRKIKYNNIMTIKLNKNITIYLH